MPRLLEKNYSLLENLTLIYTSGSTYPFSFPVSVAKRNQYHAPNMLGPVVIFLSFQPVNADFNPKVRPFYSNLLSSTLSFVLSAFQYSQRR